jgi:hypothetical protein
VSVPEVPPVETPPPLPPPPSQRSGCGVVALVLVGIVMLLPGLCSLIVIGNSGIGEGAVVWLWLIPFAIAAVGVFLIVLAIRESSQRTGR